MPLNIAPIILERLDPSLLAMAVSELEHADVTCVVCGRDIEAVVLSSRSWCCSMIQTGVA